MGSVDFPAGHACLREIEDKKITTYPLVMTNSLRTGKWPIEIVDLPIKHRELLV